MGVPLLVGVISIPFIIRNLGTEKFGVFSLALAIFGYFGLFDLGLGQSTTKFVAEALGNKEIDRLLRLIWTALGLQVLLGIVGCLLCISCIPLLVYRLLNVPPGLIGETKSVFLLMALSLPIVFGTGALRGVLSASQRFDLVNAVKIPSNCLIYLLPAVVLPFGFNLPEIVLLLLLVRLVTGLAYLFLCFKIFPPLRRSLCFDRSMMRPLFTYGGWVTVSSVLNPVLVHLNRFLIGSLLTMTAVAYYTVPSEIVGRLLILPGSLLMTVFPASSTLWGMQATQELERLLARSVKYIFLTIAPLALMLILLAPEILGLWLGQDFAQKSAPVFQILVIGILVSSLAQVPYSFLQGIGRPDITAKFHLLETPLYIVLAWLLIKSSSIEGAALAWSLRVTFDALLLFGAALRIRLISSQSFIKNGFLWGLGGLSLFAVVTFPALFLHLDLSIRIISIILGGVGFGLTVWHCALDNQDRGFFISLLHQLALRN